MLIDQFIQKLERMEQQITESLVEISEEAALNTKALVIKRIQEDGIGSYSTKKIPAYLMMEDKATVRLDKTKSNAGINFIKKKAAEKDPKDRLLNWADIRDAEGLQTDHVDLTFTGEMFRNLHIIGTNVQSGRVTTILGGTHREAQQKLEWNVARYGNFLQPTPQEKAMIIAIVKKRFQEKINQIVNG